MRNGSMFHKILQDLQMRRHFIHVSWPILHNYFVRVQVQFLVRIYRYYNVPNVSLNKINTDTLYIYLYYILDKSQVSTFWTESYGTLLAFCFNQPMLTISKYNCLHCWRLVYCWSNLIISCLGASRVRGFVQKETWLYFLNTTVHEHFMVQLT